MSCEFCSFQLKKEKMPSLESLSMLYKPEWMFWLSSGEIEKPRRSHKRNGRGTFGKDHSVLDNEMLYTLDRRRQWQPTPVLLPGKSHGWRSLVGCSPRGCKELDTTERLHFHFSLSHIGEGNGNPLQCSCLENPRDGGAWWVAVYGVAQSRIRLKQLSSSSSSSTPWIRGPGNDEELSLMEKAVG